MNALFNILTYSMGSLLLGIILTIAGIGLMFVFVKLWWKVDTFTPMSFICGFILLFSCFPICFVLWSCYHKIVL